MFIKTTTVTTALATLLAVSAPVIAGEADFPGSSWDKGQHADVSGSGGGQQQSATLQGSDWDNGERKVPGDSWDQGSRSDPNRELEDAGSGQGENVPSSNW